MVTPLARLTEPLITPKVLAVVVALAVARMTGRMIHCPDLPASCPKLWPASKSMTTLELVLTVRPPFVNMTLKPLWLQLGHFNVPVAVTPLGRVAPVVAKIRLSVVLMYA